MSSSATASRALRLARKARLHGGIQAGNRDHAVQVADYDASRRAASHRGRGEAVGSALWERSLILKESTANQNLVKDGLSLVDGEPKNTVGGGVVQNPEVPSGRLQTLFSSDSSATIPPIVQGTAIP